MKHIYLNIRKKVGDHVLHHDCHLYLSIFGIIKLEIQHNFLTNCTFLQDDCFEIGGLKAYASPWCPNMYSWLCEKFEKHLNQPEKVQSLKNFDGMYYFKNENEIEEMWNKITGDVDILITHTPPKFILDLNEFGSNRGCQKLLERIHNLSKLKVHLCK